jgi:hypothetical protein
LLSEVFEHPIAVIRHPLRDCPLVLPTTGMPALDGRRIAATMEGELEGGAP